MAHTIIPSIPETPLEAYDITITSGRTFIAGILSPMMDLIVLVLITLVRIVIFIVLMIILSHGITVLIVMVTVSIFLTSGVQ